MSKKLIFSFLFLFFFALLLTGLVLSYKLINESRSLSQLQELERRPDSDRKEEINGDSGKFRVNDILQIKGLVINKSMGNRMLVLEVGDLQKNFKRVVISKNADFATVDFDKDGKGSEVKLRESEFWNMLIPYSTTITAVCKNENCTEVTSVFVNKTTLESNSKPGSDLSSITYTPSKVVFQGRDGSFLASGVIREIDKKEKLVNLAGGYSTFLTTKIECKNFLLYRLRVNSEQRKIRISTREAVEIMKVGDQLFGKCSDEECKELLDDCMLIKNMSYIR